MKKEKAMYRIVQTTNSEEMQEQISELMEVGWKPVGGVEITVITAQNVGVLTIHYTQAIAKYEETR